MKKKLNEIFDEAKPQEIDQFSDELNAPELPDEVLASDLHFIDEIGLTEHLSPTRSNGLVAMVKQMRLYALAFKSQAGK